MKSSVLAACTTKLYLTALQDETKRLIRLSVLLWQAFLLRSSDIIASNHHVVGASKRGQALILSFWGPHNLNLGLLLRLGMICRCFSESYVRPSG